MKKLILFVFIIGATVFVNPAIAGEQKTEEKTKTIVPENEWNDEVKLWLSRSVLGEAGWRRFGEYSAIAYVYATRSKASKKYDFLGMIKRYSAAVRRPGKRRQPWLFRLGLNGNKPKGWPMDKKTRRGPQWSGLHKEAWLETLQWADNWQAGLYENPCKGANHFGGTFDQFRAVEGRWKKIKCTVKTRNAFYTSLIRVKQKRIWVRQGGKIRWNR